MLTSTSIKKKIEDINRYQLENDCNCDETLKLMLMDRLEKLERNGTE